MSQEKRKKKITLEDLAHMVANGFHAVDQRLSRVETRLDSVEVRLSSVEDGVGSLKQEILNINDRFVPWYAFDNLVGRIDKLENE